jgi:hypothetical protein
VNPRKFFGGHRGGPYFVPKANDNPASSAEHDRDPPPNQPHGLIPKISHLWLGRKSVFIKKYRFMVAEHRGRSGVPSPRSDCDGPGGVSAFCAWFPFPGMQLSTPGNPRPGCLPPRGVSPNEQTAKPQAPNRGFRFYPDRPLSPVRVSPPRGFFF